MVTRRTNGEGMRVFGVPGLESAENEPRSNPTTAGRAHHQPKRIREEPDEGSESAGRRVKERSCGSAPTSRPRGPRRPKESPLSRCMGPSLDGRDRYATRCGPAEAAAGTQPRCVAGSAVAHEQHGGGARRRRLGVAPGSTKARPKPCSPRRDGRAPDQFPIRKRCARMGPWGRT